MTYAQPSLFGDSQPDLFGTQPVSPATNRANPQHVINRFIEFEAVLREAKVWPWDAFRTLEHRRRIWPYLLNKLREIGCTAEADQWEAVLAAHAERLDVSTPPETEEE